MTSMAMTPVDKESGRISSIANFNRSNRGEIDGYAGTHLYLKQKEKHGKFLGEAQFGSCFVF